MTREEKTQVAYVGFMDLEKSYDKETLQKASRMYDTGGKLLKVIRKLLVVYLASVRSKGDESAFLRIDCGVR